MTQKQLFTDNDEPLEEDELQMVRSGSYDFQGTQAKEISNQKYSVKESTKKKKIGGNASSMRLS